MPVELAPDRQGVRANCPDCKGAVTTFEVVTGGAKVKLERAANESDHYYLLRCASCGRGGMSCVEHTVTSSVHGPRTSYRLKQFFPRSVESFSLPNAVPADLTSEFREAELVASVGAWRAASALMRSTLEKALKHSGYSKGPLAKLIDEAAADGAITAARSVRAHDEIRVLGNDVLHDEWRAITQEEFELSHRYTQRILEDLYDDRPSVLKLLLSKNRTPLDASPAAAPA
jgi:hypothetical protein